MAPSQPTWFLKPRRTYRPPSPILFIQSPLKVIMQRTVRIVKRILDKAVFCLLSCLLTNGFVLHIGGVDVVVILFGWLSLVVLVSCFVTYGGGGDFVVVWWGICAMGEKKHRNGLCERDVNFKANQAIWI